MSYLYASTTLLWFCNFVIVSDIKKYEPSNLFFFKSEKVFFKIFFFWLLCVFVVPHGLSPVAASWGGGQASHRGGFSCWGVQALGAWASVVVAHGLSCPAACGIFPDQGLNPRPLGWQADSWPLHHQEALRHVFNTTCYLIPLVTFVVYPCV